MPRKSEPYCEDLPTDRAPKKSFDDVVTQARSKFSKKQLDSAQSHERRIKRLAEATLRNPSQFTPEEINQIWSMLTESLPQVKLTKDQLTALLEQLLQQILLQHDAGQLRTVQQNDPKADHATHNFDSSDKIARQFGQFPRRVAAAFITLYFLLGGFTPSASAQDAVPNTPDSTLFLPQGNEVDAIDGITRCVSGYAASLSPEVAAIINDPESVAYLPQISTWFEPSGEKKIERRLRGLNEINYFDTIDVRLQPDLDEDAVFNYLDKMIANVESCLNRATFLAREHGLHNYFGVGTGFEPFDTIIIEDSRTATKASIRFNEYQRTMTLVLNFADPYQLNELVAQMQTPPSELNDHPHQSDVIRELQIITRAMIYSLSALEQVQNGEFEAPPTLIGGQLVQYPSRDQYGLEVLSILNRIVDNARLMARTNSIPTPTTDNPITTLPYTRGTIPKEEYDRLITVYTSEWIVEILNGIVQQYNAQDGKLREFELFANFIGFVNDRAYESESPFVAQMILSLMNEIGWDETFAYPLKIQADGVARGLVLSEMMRDQLIRVLDRQADNNVEDIKTLTAFYSSDSRMLTALPAGLRNKNQGFMNSFETIHVRAVEVMIYSNNTWTKIGDLQKTGANEYSIVLPREVAINGVIVPINGLWIHVNAHFDTVGVPSEGRFMQLQ